MNKKKLSLYLFISILVVFVFFISSYSYINKEEQRLLKNKYELLSNQLSKNIDFLIEDKKNATQSFSIALAKSENIKNFIISKDFTLLDFENLSLELREETKFKNVWFQIMDKEGKSLYRSWSKEKGDSLLFRYDVQNILKNQKNQSTISVGKYDMTFKSMVPIFDKNSFIGIFEVITHFNSISRILKESNMDVLILADKRFYKKLTHPFSKKFLDEYYIANLDETESLVKTIEKYDIEKIINLNNFLLIDDNFIFNYKITNNKNENIAYIILVKKLKDIDISEISNFKKSFIFYLIFTIILFVLISTLIFYYFYSNKMLTEKKKSQQILDSQKNIIIITDGKILNNANKQFLEFFNEFKSIDEFKKLHNCICEKFIDINDENYLIDKDYDGRNWAEHILAHPEKSFKCAMEKNKELEYFAMNVNLSQFKNEDKPYIIVTFTNITLDIKQKFQLEKLNNNLEFLVEMKTKELKNLNDSLEIKIKEEIAKNKEKDAILFQQNKMAAMGEMLNNIAHQWRQPLSAISSSASSMQVKKLVGELDDAEIVYYCNHIMESSNYLSKTIEDFRNFFKQDKEKQEFSLKEIIYYNKNLISEKLKSKDILFDVIIKDEKNIFGYKNEFQQAILNIINNSIDALIENNISKKLILIELDNSSLSIKDNAKGIKKELLEHIFEPYFTTKHKSQGTGIGLYMAQNILENNMNFKITVKNENFSYEGENFYGANFTITLRK